MEARGSRARERPWAAFAKTFAAGALLTLAGYLTLAYVVDPYETGRARLLSVGAVRPQGPRTTAALRGRDPAYEGAILGNSHIQPVEPARLSQATGIPFVQLSVIATGPQEQFVLLDWFLRHHPAPRALVIAADEHWCTDDPALPNAKPFPFWLFSGNTPGYVAGLLRWSVLEEVFGRLAWLSGTRRETARADGWWDNEQDYLAMGYGTAPARLAERDTPAPDTPDPGRAGPAFPAAGRLGEALARLPEATAVVVVFPPLYAAGLPRPGTPREAAVSACKAAIVRALDRHRLNAVVDWRRDRPELHEAAQFFDQTHYRHPLAQALTREIAEAVRGLLARAAKGARRLPAPSP